MLEVGLEVPVELAAAIDPWPGLQEYADAFAELSAGRPWVSAGLGGSQPAPIAQVEMEAYARMSGYADDAETLDEFRTCIRAQDRAWLMEHAARQQDAKDTQDKTDEQGTAE